MTGPDFDHFCQLVRTRSGLALTADKEYLVTSRLGPVARSAGLGGVPELLARLRANATEDLVRRCVEAMATHESFFFRDNTPFEQLSTRVLPQLIAARQAARALRIWCAACSSGQEPYSVAMILKELSPQLSGWRTEIIATDMSAPILEKARAGQYSSFEVNRGLSPERLRRWFAREGDLWTISPELRQMVSFRQHNLLSGTSEFGRLDIILCRNVLIYFDVQQKQQILANLSKTLAADGALILGSAETVIGLTSAFRLEAGSRGIYRQNA